MHNSEQNQIWECTTIVHRVRRNMTKKKMSAYRFPIYKSTIPPHKHIKLIPASFQLPQVVVAVEVVLVE